MKVPHSKTGPALAGVVALAAMVFPTPAARAQTSELSVQVTPEVTVVGADGARAVPLTARISSPAPQGGVVVNFEVTAGEANVTTRDGSCTVPAGKDTCEAQVSSVERGKSLVQAWVEGTSRDDSEGRYAAADGVPVPVVGGLAAPGDCRPEDGDACNPGTEPEPGDTAEPDGTDVVEITWETFAAARLACVDDDPSDGPDREYDRPDERTQMYQCALTDLSDVPIDGVAVQWKNIDGIGADPESGADGACTTDQAGRCTQTVSLPGATPGEANICFWADGDTDGAYDPAGDDVDGGACEEVRPGQAQGDQATDAAYINLSPPFPDRVDVSPDLQGRPRRSSFSLRAVVYDQFGEPFAGGTQVRGEVYEGSVLDDDGNTPDSVDVEGCLTGADGTCEVQIASADVLGPSLVCLWVGDTPTEMFGDPFNTSQCDEELSTETGEAGQVPDPGRDRDIVRLEIRTDPKVDSVAPAQSRPDFVGVVAIAGSDFSDGARISFSGAGVRVTGARVVSPTLAEAEIIVDPDAPTGPRDIVVTNPDLGSFVCTGCFTVIGQGYWLVASDGGIFAYGDAVFTGSTGGQSLNRPIVGMASTPTGKGYWLVASDGGVFAFGDAPFLGSTGDVALNQPIVGLAAHPSGQGYWLAAADGGIFAYGQARFHGSTGGARLSDPVVDIAASPTGEGYTLVAADGGVFTFGDARFLGSTGDLVLNEPIVAVGVTGTGRGYWLVAADGGIFAYGDAFFSGSTAEVDLASPIVAMAPTPSSRGYWLVSADGGVFAFGDAEFHGSAGDSRLNQPIVGFARR